MPARLSLKRDNSKLASSTNLSIKKDIPLEFWGKAATNTELPSSKITSRQWVSCVTQLPISRNISPPRHVL
jgi:hypothetical protein